LIYANQINTLIMMSKMILHTHPTMKRLKQLILVMTLGMASIVQGQLDPHTATIKTIFGGNPVVIDEPTAQTQVNYTEPVGSTVLAVKNRLTLSVDPNYEGYFGSPMEVRVALRVERWNASNTQLNDTLVSLKVFYNPFTDSTYLAAQSARFKDNYKMNVYLDSVFVNGVSKDTLPANLKIDADIFVIYQQTFDPTSAVSIQSILPVSCMVGQQNVTKELLVSWNDVPGAIEYQLEWLHINNYGMSGVLPTSSLFYNFKLNSTRITTTSTQYPISMVFDQGYLVCRVRAVGLDDNDPTFSTPIFGAWSTNQTGNVASAPSAAKFEITAAMRHSSSLNWQYASTYAEEGKRKEVVSYFDGSLRNRQTVTRINTDDNVIVGETIYDHQGRPAVTVLPAPVVDPECTPSALEGPALGYYPNFNKNMQGQGYSRLDFDVSDSLAVCAVGAEPLNPNSGASLYYSPNNPVQDNQQAYVPDAQNYPMVQVEYTPDNTGRIRRQSGVGPQYQLGSTHETRYLYGQPNQLELDRLFGNEVGFQSHYKKNVVIDAHGQASISYLDQEGRVIATALAGAAPGALEALESEANAQTPLTVNALGTNNVSNVRDDFARTLVFSTQLLLEQNTDVTIHYDFEIEPLQFECLDGICVDCVYELKLEFIDECGVNLISSTYSPKLVGKFGGDPQSGYSFHATCTENMVGTPDIDSILLSGVTPGAYSFNKRLSLYTPARDELIRLYLDTAQNPCLKTLEDFQQEQLAQIDFSGCEVDCDLCLQELGTLEDYIAEGKGSVDDYHVLANLCRQACEDAGQDLCAMTLQMMEMDMSPGGQYGECRNPNTMNFQVSMFPLSVYNNANELPSANGTPFWRNPLFPSENGNLPIFVTAGGDTARVYVEWDDTDNWSPAPLNNSMVKYDPILDQYYIYPEELANVEDFINLFELSWSRSLVIYHPEYCYYETCARYAQVVNENDYFTSNSFDHILESAATFQQALDAHLLPTGYYYQGTPPSSPYSGTTIDWAQPISGISSNDNAWDPFVYYGTDFSANGCANYGQQLNNKFTQYELINNTWYSMPQMAAYMARCATNFYANPPSSCFQFGSQFNGVWNSEILDAEWNHLKALYRSEKQQIKQILADCIAIQECELFTGCIGQENFSPFSQEIQAAGGWNNFPFSSPFFDPDQPCSIWNKQFYVGKIRRFENAASQVPFQDANQAAYEIYLNTGQCPVPFALQHLLSSLASEGNLDANLYHLNNNPQLSGFFQALNDFNIPGTIPPLYQQVTVNGNTLEIDWVVNPSMDIYTSITLTRPGSRPWDDYTNLSALEVTGNGSFNLKGWYVNSSNQAQFEIITGTISNFDIETCSFADVCTTSNFGRDLELLFNALISAGSFVTSAPKDIDPLVSGANSVSGLETQWLLAAVDDGPNLNWRQINSTRFELRAQANSIKLAVEFLVMGGLTSWSGVTHFSDLQSNGEHLFKVKAHTSTNQVFQLYGKVLRSDANGNAWGIPVGTCDLPTPARCRTLHHQALRTWFDLMNDVLVTKDFDGSQSIDLFNSIYMDHSILSQLNYELDSTSSSFQNDTLRILADECEIILTASDTLSIADVIELVSIDVSGERSLSGVYYSWIIEAKFDDGNGGTIIGQINGSSSCIGVLPCVVCPSDTTSMQEAMAMREELIANGKYGYDEFITTYQTYKTAVQSYNSFYSYTIEDSLYVQEVSFDDYLNLRLDATTESYTRYLGHAHPEVDRPEWIRDIRKFAAYYGNGINVDQEYERYKKSIERYNERAVVHQNDTLSKLPIQTFAHGKLAKKTGEYLDYIESKTGEENEVSNIDIFAQPSLGNSTEEHYYQLYVDAYLQFVENQQNEIGEVCKEYKRVSPFYSIEDIIQSNLLCSQQGIDLFENYLETFFDTTGCPQELPRLRECDGTFSLEGYLESQRFFALYVSSIEKFNASYWAQSRGFVMQPIFANVGEFSALGMKSSCIAEYETYLEEYWDSYDSLNPILPPLSIEEFVPCIGHVEPVRPCLNAYNQYFQCKHIFDGWQKNTQFPYELTYVVSSFQNFQELDLCNCADEYCSRLQSVIDGLVTFESQQEFDLYTDISLMCNTPAPCVEEPVDWTFPHIDIEVVDDCVEMLTNQAYFNAQMLYDLYIDSLVHHITQAYDNHCLSVQEELTYTYDSKLYHFTLYYYDQAGNLIKTIPPAGVEILPITSSSDALANQIHQDRVNGTQTVFTSHRLATRYMYNSLNQLVTQHTPDTDDMNLFEIELPTGLFGLFQAQKIHMVDANVGYMAGDIQGQAGMLFKTTNGGTTWTRVDGVVGADLKSMVLWSNFGVAVGSDGIALVTANSGGSWGVLPTWNVTGAIEHYNEVYHRSLGGSSFEVVLVGENSTILRTTNLSSFTLMNNGLPTGLSLTSITWDGSAYLLAANDNEKGRMFTYNGTTWTEISNFSAPVMSKVDLASASLAYAAGQDGRVYKNVDFTNANSRWQLIDNNLTTDIQEIRFFNPQQGAVLSNGNIFLTQNAGSLWQPQPLPQMNHLNKSLEATMMITVGNNGVIRLIVPAQAGNSPFIPVHSPTNTQHLSAGWIGHQVNGPAQSQYALAVTSTTHLYTTTNGQASMPNWSTYSIASYLTGGLTVKDIQMETYAPNKLRGLILLSNGSILRFDSDASVISGNFLPINGANEEDLLVINGSPYIATVTNSGLIKSYDLSTTANTLNTEITTGLTNTKSLVVNGAQLVLVGESFAHVNGNTNTTTNQALRTNPLRLNRVESDGTSTAVIGSDGVVYVKSGSNWAFFRHATNNELHDIHVVNNAIYLCGANGYFVEASATGNILQTNPIVLTNGQTSENHLSETLYDIASNGNTVYLVGQNGRVLYTPDITALPFASLTHGARDIYRIRYKSGVTFTSVGAKATLREHTAAQYLTRKEVLGHALKDVHFTSATHGTIVGDNFFIRRTTDGGVTWQVVRPQGNVAPSQPLTRVIQLPGSSSALVFGGTQSFRIANNVAVPDASLPVNVTDVAQAGNLIYATEAQSVHVYSTLSNSIVQTTATGQTNTAVATLANGSFAVTNATGSMKYYSAQGALVCSATIPATATINDLTFLSPARLVAVGDNGGYYHTDNVTLDANGYPTGMTWNAYAQVYSAQVDPYLVSMANQINLRTVAATDAEHVLYGGSYGTNFSTNPLYPFVRKLYHAPNRFSARFFYDALGRLVVSQNARQYNAPERKFSYTRYDALGRVVEVGEKTDPATGTGLRFKQIFGAMVSGTYNPTVISETKLISWIENNDGERREVTKSYYDEPLITQVPVTFDPHTQRKRITHVTYEELYDDNDQTYDHASHFVYDIHGNVKTLVQDNRKMAVEFASLANQRFKRMDYTYDLVSGNVHRMSVTSVDTSGTLQPADQWHHAYRYDADNRIVEVFTSRHTPLLNGGWSNAMLENELTENPDWHKDAHYVYYDHGPLARVELGKDQLQGLDYVYNLQGWLKGVNATSLTNTLDPGKDGVTTGANPVNGNFAKDVFAFSLHYHQGDYTPIGATAPAATINSGSHAAANSSDLYNGNIRFMQTTLTNPTTREAMPMLNAYRYDQLNRLAQSRSYENGYSANEWNPTSYANNYFNAFTFDAMGNILTQKRHKRDGTQIEDMTYRYKYDVNNKLLRNRLYHVNDAIAANVDDTDIDDMGAFVSNPLLIETANNYSYDEEGRLIKDTQEGIERITWRVDGKVKSIERPSDSGKKNVSFDYNAFGNRIAKHVFDDNWNLEKSTYYILDAQGNQLSMYEHTVDSNQVNFTLAERNIYGASRLGRTNLAVNMYSSTPEAPISEVLGYKNYELSNHLGNVLTVINDIKIPLSDDNETVSEYQAGIVSISDYSPFGVQLDGRTLSSESYRYGFQGQEKDDEIKGEGNSVNYKYRMHDPRVGRFFAVDPMHHLYSYNSPYAFSENRVMDAIELEGLEIFKITNYGNEIYKLNYIGHSDVLIVIDEFNKRVDQSMGVNFKYQDLQYQMRNYEYQPQPDGTYVLTVPHRGESYKNPGPAHQPVNDRGSFDNEFKNPASTFNILFRDVTRTKTQHVAGIFNLDRRSFTAVNGVVSQNYAAPQSSSLVSVTVTVDYALFLANKTAENKGLSVSVIDAAGNILATGTGGQDLEFQVPSNSTFTVNVTYSGAANPQIQANIAVVTQGTVEVIDNDSPTPSE
jgi:RHS repeat-associated protein